MMMELRILLFLMFFSSVVSANEETIQELCSAYSDPIKALECHEQLENIIKEPENSNQENRSNEIQGKLKEPQKATLKGSSWVIGEETTSRIAGEREIAAWVYGQELVNAGQNREEEPRLVLMCRGRTFYVFVDWKTHVGWGEIPVVMNVDDGPAVQNKWRGSTTGNEMFYSVKKAGMFHHFISGAEQVKINAGTSSGQQLSTIFKLDGMKKVTKKLRQYCEFQGEPSMFDLIDF